MTHAFKGFSSFLLTNRQWYHHFCLPPHRRHILQNYVLLLFMAVREEPLGTFGYFWKHKLSLGLTQSPRSWGQLSSFPEEITLHPLCLPGHFTILTKALKPTGGSYVSHLWSPGGQHCPVQFCTRRAWIDETSSTVNLLWTACLKASHLWLGV